MNVNPLKIGNVTVDFPVMLAPMAGFTDAVMRLLARRYHCGMAFTEVTSAEGLARGAKQSTHILETTPDELPVAAHIYGANPESLAQAAILIEKTGQFQTIDLNCGCPVARIVARGAGAALIKHPEKIGRIVRAMTKAVSLPITVKTRLGAAPGQMNIMEILRAVEDNGASAITIHARYTTGGHTGQADWQALARVKEASSIPVIGNGGVTCAEDVFRMFAETGVDGVMIGKAAIGNPWIFEETWAALHGRRGETHALAEHRAVIEEHLQLLIGHIEKARKTRRKQRLSLEQHAVLHFRAHLLGYIKGFRNSSDIRRTLQDMRTIEKVMQALDFLMPTRSGA